MDFDVLIVGDFHVAGGTAVLAGNEITALHRAGYKVGLLPIQISLVKAELPIRTHIRELINAGQAALVDPEKNAVTARLAIFENPRCFLTQPEGRIQIDAAESVMAVHFPAFNAIGESAFDIDTVTGVVAALGVRDLLWAPVSPIVRDSLASLADKIKVAAWDWPYIVEAAAWKADRNSPLNKGTPTLGRHSRPSREKWPVSRAEMFRIYPSTAPVRLLGFGREALNLIGDRVPPAWRVFEFNEVSPAQFLRTIDYFVYYHHPHYVEAFGLAIAEAMASGLLPILPAYLERTFGEAALYPKPADAFATVQELHRDWPAYRKRATAALDFVHERVSSAGYIKRIAALVGGPREPSTLALIQPPTTASAKPVPRSFDVLIVSDMTQPGDIDLRIAEEMAALARAGYTTGVVHFPSKPVTHRVATHVHASVRKGYARVVTPAESARARLILAFQPHTLLSGMEGFKMLPRISAAKIIAIADAIPNYDVEAKSGAMAYVFNGKVSWAPTNGWIRAALERRFSSVPLEPMNWLPVVPEIQTNERSSRRSPVVGGLLPNAVKKEISENWTLIEADDFSRPRLLQRLDVLAWYSDRAATEWPDATIAHAMAAGKLVLIPQEFESHFGLGATYCAPELIQTTIERFWMNGSLRKQASKRARQRAANFYSEASYRRRVGDLIGKPMRPTRAKAEARRTPKSPVRPRVLFLASNGTGLGHVTRLLAIARRSHAFLDPVFATFGHAIDVAAKFEYPVHYIPSPVYADLKTEEWDAWLRLDLIKLIETYDIKLVVFDGNTPPPGLIKAAHSFTDCQTAWVRRGMWNPNATASFDQAAFFELIIEPGELAASQDRGPTARRRQEVLQVDPILLLDNKELLSREHAAQLMMIDPLRPTALVQLGSGSNRDIVGLTNAVVRALQRHSELQILVAEWSIGSSELLPWSGTTRLKGYPIGQYRRAIDFAISAAGYNTFHETIHYALPTIFIPNADPSMDDQVGRARFAQDAEAAFELSENEVEDIAPFIDVLMSGEARARLVANCRKLRAGNGALAASRALGRLLTHSQHSGI